MGVLNRWDPLQWAPAAALALIIIAPYSGLAFPFQFGLFVQAGIVLGACSVLWATMILQEDRVWSRFPRPVQGALILYAAAAIWGTVVGLVSGNPLRFVLSQAFSMLILVFAAYAFGSNRAFGPQRFAQGLLAGILGSVVIKLTVMAVKGPQPVADRLVGDLPFKIGSGGVAPLALVLFTALMLARPSLIWGIGTLAAGLHLIMSMTRGAWAISLGALFVVAVMAMLSTPDLHRRVGVAFAVLVALFAGGYIVSTANIVPVAQVSFGTSGGSPAPTLPRHRPLASRQGPMQISATSDRGDGIPVGLFDIPAGAAALEFSWLVRGESGQRIKLWAKFLDAHGDTVFTAYPSAPGLGHWINYNIVISLPERASQVKVGSWVAAAQGTWSIASVQIRAIQWTSTAFARQFRWRLQRFGRSIVQPRADISISYRLRELKAVTDMWRVSSPEQLFLGRGLGARIPFRASGWSADGTPKPEKSTSYLHNFYVFLGFKLGLAGILALIGLLLLTVWFLHETVVRKGRFHHEGWFFLAASSAWIGYLVWSAFSPEIYDFRIAPIWGALIAAASSMHPRRDNL